MLTDLEIKSTGIGQNEPKYKYLKSYLLKKLTSNEIKPGDGMPSEQVLAKAAGVARNTVRQAVSELVKEGVLHRIPGKGTFAGQFQIKGQKQAVFGIIIPEMRRLLYPSLMRGFDKGTKAMHNQVMVWQSDYDFYKQAEKIGRAHV